MKINERLKKELELLKSCETNLGFFQRLAMVTIPLLRKEKETAQFIDRWEKELDQTEQINAVSEEVWSFLKTIWHASNQFSHKRRNIVTIIQMIRGPRFELAATLADRIRRPLLELSDKAEQNLPRFLEQANQKSILEYQADCECDPKYLWHTLKLVEMGWTRRKQTIFDIKNPGRLPGNIQEIGVAAFKFYNEFLIQNVAEELRNPENPKKYHYFNRQRFEHCIDRFFKELELLNPTPLKVSTPISKKRNDPRIHDKEVAKEIMKGMWEIGQETDGILREGKGYDQTQRTIAFKVQQLHKKGDRRFQKKEPYSLETYMKWADEVDPLPVEKRRKRHRTPNISVKKS